VTALRLARAVRAARQKRQSRVLEPIERAGHRPAALLVPGEAAGERRHRIGEAMARAGREILDKAEGRLPNLAIVASVAPLVGLFRTL